MEIKELDLNQEHRDSIARNLNQLMKQRDIHESKVAQDLGIPVMTIRRLLSGETTDPRVYTLKAIADYFKVPIDVLLNKQVINFNSIAKSSKPIFIPLLPWDAVNSIAEIDLNSWQDWVPVTCASDNPLGANSFALQSRPSMYPRFPHGTVFILDPDLMPADGDLVLAKLPKTEEITLRELCIDPPEWILNPISSGGSVLHYKKDEHPIIAVVFLTIFYNRKTAPSRMK